MDANTDLAFRLKVSAKEESLLKLLGPFENHIMVLQSVLVWEDPRYSAALFVAVHILFWMACTLQVFYLVGIVGSLTVFLNMWTNHIWPEIKVPVPLGEDTEEWTPVHPRLLSVHEIVSYSAYCLVLVESYIQAAVNLRKHHHTIFFFKMTSILTFTAVLGYYIPGVYLAYLIIISILLVPCAIYHSWCSHLSTFLKPYISQMEEKMNIKRRKKRKAIVDNEPLEDSECDDDIGEFAPQTQGSNPSLLSIGRESDEEGSSFTPGAMTPSRDSCNTSQYSADFEEEASDLSLTPQIAEMPSVNSSMSSFLPDVSLMPTMDSNQSKEDDDRVYDEDKDLDTTIEDSAFDTSSEKSDSVNFVSSHFDDDSSVDDEDKLGEGMDFSSVNDVTDAEQDFQRETSGLLATGHNILSAAIANPVLAETVSRAAPLISNTVSSMLSSTRSGLQHLTGGKSSTPGDSVECSGSNVAEAMAEALQESRDTTPVEEHDLLEDFEFLDKEDAGVDSDDEKA